MDSFSYLSVLLSIILGLAITQVLQGVRGLLLTRSRVRLYLPSPVWAALILLIATQLWWASFGLGRHADWTFAEFGIVLLQTTELYMMAALVLPDFGVEGTDLRDHYERERRPFFGILLAILATSIAKDRLVDGRMPHLDNIAFHALFAGLTLTAMIVRRPAFHHAVAIGCAVLLVVYITFLFARPG